MNSLNGNSKEDISNTMSQDTMFKIHRETYLHLIDWTDNLLSSSPPPESWKALGQYLQTYQTGSNNETLVSVGLMIEEAVNINDGYILNMIGYKLTNHLKKKLAEVEETKVKAS